VPSHEIRNIRVLVVDDESSFRASLARILQVNGFHVVEADGPDVAIGSLADPRCGIDIALVDVVLPGMNGFELAGRIREKVPAPKVLLMSGYPTHILKERYGFLDEPLPILQKPFQAKMLIAKILEVLGCEDGV
jgi:DNA-binding response OmpR family regulator